MYPEALIVGTGAQAKYALEICHLRKISVVGLIALPEEEPHREFYGVQVLGSLEDFEKVYAKNGNPPLLLCCSRNKTKEKLEKMLSRYSPRYTNAIHPKAVIATTGIIGHGIIVNANAIIQPYARIGNHVMIHAGVVVEHDCVIGDYVNVALNASLAGHVRIAKGATVYMGAVILPTLSIGEYSVVGAGAVVLKDVKDNTTVVGVPATEIMPNKTVLRGDVS